MIKQSVPRDLLTVAQVAALTGLSVKSVRRRIQDGTLPRVTVKPNRVRVREAHLGRLIVEHKSPAAAQGVRA